MHQLLGVSAPRRRGLRGAAVAVVAGVVMFVAGMVVMGFDVVSRAVDSGARDGARVELAVPGRATVDLAAGDYVVVALGRGLVSSEFSPATDLWVNTRGPFADPLVTVTAADGQPVALHRPRVDILEDRPGTDAVSVVGFTLITGGEIELMVEHAGDGTGPVESVTVRTAGGGIAGLGRFGADDMILGFALLGGGGLLLTLGVTSGIRRLVGGALHQAGQP